MRIQESKDVGTGIAVDGASSCGNEGDGVAEEYAVVEMNGGGCGGFFGFASAAGSSFGGSSGIASSLGV